MSGTKNALPAGNYYNLICKRIFSQVSKGLLKLAGSFFIVSLTTISVVNAQTSNVRAEIAGITPGRLNISFTLINDSKQDVQVLGWNTPLDGGFNGENFDVLFDSKSGLLAVPYRERHVKRAPASIEDYVLLKAGESTSVDLDISYGYLTELAGFYSISYDSQIEYYGIPLGVDAESYEFNEQDRNIVTLESNKVVAYQAEQLSAFESKLPPEFASCSASEQTQIDTALTAAETMATTAAEALNSTPVSQRATAERYTTWFGSYLSSRYISVLTNFNAIQDATANKQLKFSCGSPRCGRSTFAFVYSNSPYEVFLCPSFWSAELTGTDSRAGTIIHELSHFTILGGTDDHQYGQSAAKQLGASDPNRAINNADSHEYFAENTPALSMSGGTVTPGTPEPSPTNESLTLGTALAGNLEAGQWRYFEVNGAGEISLYNLSADLDLYVGNGARPTISNYQCRPFFGGSMAETCTVDSSKITFIGITGAAASSFSLIANAAVTPAAPSEDQPNGSGDSGVQTLALETPVFGSLEEGNWAYFQVTGAAEINLYNLSSDLDLYIGDGPNPTADNFLCRPYLSGTSAETCAINDSTGTTYVGINAFSGAGTYSVVANAVATLQTGTTQTLSVNISTSGSLEEGSWDYFEVTGATQVQLSELSADLDLYVNRAGIPTDSEYDCRPFSSSTTEESCSLNPQGTTFIGVNGFSGGTYSLIATAETVTDGAAAQALTLGEAVTGSLASGEWAYYEVANATEVSLFGLSADLDLYVSSSGQPSDSNYTCRPFIPGDNIENCTITSRGTIQIGVNGFDSGSYSLVATNNSAANVGEAVVVEVSQESYVAGDPLALTMTVKGDQNMDTYVALVLPSGDLFTFAPSGAISAPNEVIPYHTNLQVNGEQTHSILNLPLPSGLPSGVYGACGLLVKTGQSVAEENWLGLNCTDFMVNPGSGKEAGQLKKVAKK